MRLDMAVDGEENVVSEVDVVPHPVSPSNPYGNVFLPKETILKSESESGYGDKPTYDYQRFISSKFAFSNFKCD